MRKTWVFVVVAVVVLLAATVMFLANPSRHRATIQAELEKRLGRKVSLGDMSLGFLPLRFRVENAVIADDPAVAQTEPFVTAERLDVQIDLMPLLRGNVKVSSLELQRPKVELIKTRQGAWNLSTLGPTATQEAPQGAAATEGREFTLDQLRIIDGEIGFTDLQRNQPRAAYQHIDLTLLNYASGKPFSFDLTARVLGEGAQEIHLKGDGGPIAGNPADTPFRGTLSLNQVGIDGLLKFLDTTAVTHAEGALTGQSDLESRSGVLSTTGKLKLEGAKFNNVAVGYPIEATYTLAAKPSEGEVTISAATLQLGQTPFSFAGVLNTMATPPTMDLAIKSGDVSISEVARLASAFGVAFAPGATVAGRIRGDVRVHGTFDRPIMNGAVTGSDLQISGQGMPQPVLVKSVNIALSPATIQSNEFNATSGDTTLAAQFAMHQYTSNSPSIDLKVRSAGATLPEIQSIAKAYGVTGLDQISGAGNLNFDLRAAGSLQSLNSTNVMRALNGVINVDFSPLHIAGFDAVNELVKIGGFKSDLSAQNDTEIVRVAGQILVKNGIAQTDDLRAQVGIGSVATAGSADLAAEALNLKLTAVFSKAFSDKVGRGSGGILNAALSNSSGELVLPAIVTGSFVQPKFAPDLKTVAQMQKQRLLPSLENPSGTAKSVIEALTGKPKDAQAQPSSEKPSVLKGILDVFGGAKSDKSK